MRTLIRQNWHINWSPSSCIAIDELIIPFYGRLIHIVKIKNKPIKEGFKIWVLGDHGYVIYAL
jgi:hypothetical protein